MKQKAEIPLVMFPCVVLDVSSSVALSGAREGSGPFGPCGPGLFGLWGPGPCDPDEPGWTGNDPLFAE